MKCNIENDKVKKECEIRLRNDAARFTSDIHKCHLELQKEKGSWF